jgi:hypothetical protein
VHLQGLLLQALPSALLAGLAGLQLVRCGALGLLLLASPALWALPHLATASARWLQAPNTSGVCVLGRWQEGVGEGGSVRVRG